MWQSETMSGQSKEAILLRAEAATNPTQTFEECMDYFSKYSRYYDDVSKSIILPSLNYYLYLRCLGEESNMYSE